MNSNRNFVQVAASLAAATLIAAACGSDSAPEDRPRSLARGF